MAGRRLALVLGLLALFALVHVLASRQTGFVSIQGQTNLWFVAHRSLGVALEEYPKVRPPLYPVLLWLAAHAGVSAAWFNQALFDATLLLLMTFPAVRCPMFPPGF